MIRINPTQEPMTIQRVAIPMLVFIASSISALLSLADAAPAALPVSTPAQPKRIYLANDDHTDFMWTADAETYANVFVEMLDFHLKLADETATNAAPYRNRFNADGNYWLWNYEQKKTPAEFARLIGRVKDGTLSAPLNALVSCYGGQPAEAVLRGMYYAGRLERRHGLRLPPGGGHGEPDAAPRSRLALRRLRRALLVARGLRLREPVRQPEARRAPARDLLVDRA